MILSRKWRWLVALLAALALVAAACGDSDDAGSATTGAGTDTTVGDTGDGSDTTDAGDTSDTSDTTTEATTPDVVSGEPSDATVSFGIFEPASIDSLNIVESEGFQVARLLYRGLTTLNEDLEAEPAVATEWSTADNVVWTFTLRDDVTFHNGEAVTAQSFVDGFTRVANPDLISDASYYGSYVAGIEGWEDVEFGEATEISGAVAIDDTTLELTLLAPYALLPTALAHPVFSPVTTDAASTEDSDAPVGNGPYKMDGSWERGQSIRLLRNEDYFGDPAGPAAIEFKIYESPDTMFLDFEGGDLDISIVPPEALPSAPDDFGDRLISTPVGASTFLGLPTATAPFDNPDIRRAISLAIDRETIIDALLGGSATAADGFAPPFAPGAVPTCDACAYDPETAKELFDNAGGIPGNTLPIYFEAGIGSEDFLEAVGNQLTQNLGIDVDLQGRDFDPLLDLLYSPDLDGAFQLGWLWDVPTAENFIGPLFGTGAEFNLVGYANDDLDAALEKFRIADSEAAGNDALADAQVILGEDMPGIPLWFSNADKVYSERLTNVVHSVGDFTYLENITVSEG
jgi:peptide/nickel transport system substrate-binding protein/oligopeptide transport system substrate-binding protein